MAKATSRNIQALRMAAANLEVSPAYQWGHMGSCNCGFLAQEITQLAPGEIHRRALLGNGDWSEQLNDYCPVNGLPFDEIISSLLCAGFDVDDLRHLERLSDPKILGRLPAGSVLTYNARVDVVRYFHTWADSLENQLLIVERFDQPASIRRVVFYDVPQEAAMTIKHEVPV